MTKPQQRRFIRELQSRITKDAISHLARSPDTENWDGHELRCLVADLAEGAAGMSQIRREPRNKRARAYRNTMLIL